MVSNACEHVGLLPSESYQVLRQFGYHSICPDSTSAAGQRPFLP
jgi:hypothetical protein